MHANLPLSEIYDFIKQPIPMLVIAIIMGIVGVYYFAPLLFLCEAALIYEFYHYGRTRRRRWSFLQYFIFVGITASVLFVAQYLLARAQHPATAQQSQTVSQAVPIYMACDSDHLPIHIQRGSAIHVIRLHPDFLRGIPTMPSVGVIDDISASADKDRDWPSSQEGKWLTLHEIQALMTKKVGLASPFIYKCSASSGKPVDDVSIEMTVNNHAYPVPIDPLNGSIAFSFYVVNVCPTMLFVTWPHTAIAHSLDEPSKRQVPLKIVKRTWPGDLMIFQPSAFHWNGIGACNWG